MVTAAPTTTYDDIAQAFLAIIERLVAVEGRLAELEQAGHTTPGSE
jgi:hypothetical protein